jgi:hypothetical protein
VWTGLRSGSLDEPQVVKAAVLQLPRLHHSFLRRSAEKSQQFPGKMLPAILLKEVPGALDLDLLARGRDEVTKAW